MPRVKKDPNAVVFTFVENTEKPLAAATLRNYKNALNKLAEYSAEEHTKDNTKPLIQTKEDLLSYPQHVLYYIEKHIAARLTKSATLAAVFYIIGRQSEDHVYVKEFRKLYYTESWKAKLRADGKDVPE